MFIYQILHDIVLQVVDVGQDEIGNIFLVYGIFRAISYNVWRVDGRFTRWNGFTINWSSNVEREILDEIFILKGLENELNFFKVNLVFQDKLTFPNTFMLRSLNIITVELDPHATESTLLTSLPLSSSLYSVGELWS